MLTALLHDLLECPLCTPAAASLEPSCQSRTGSLHSDDADADKPVIAEVVVLTSAWLACNTAWFRCSCRCMWSLRYTFEIMFVASHILHTLTSISLVNASQSSYCWFVKNAAKHSRNKVVVCSTVVSTSLTKSQCDCPAYAPSLFHRCWHLVQTTLWFDYVSDECHLFSGWQSQLT